MRNEIAKDGYPKVLQITNEQENHFRNKEKSADFQYCCED